MSAFSSQSMADSMQVDFVDLLGLQSNSLPLIQFQDCDFPTVDDILSAAVVTTETPVPCAGKSKSTTNQPNKSRRKREVKKKQPDRANFASDQEYTVAWEAWRLARVKNNESVKRSREKARERSAESKKRLRSVEEQRRNLKSEAMFLERCLSVMTRAVHDRNSLSSREHQWLFEHLVKSRT
jgi:hypothetical protein